MSVVTDATQQRGDNMAVYVSFHYERDNWRVQQVLNMGAIEGQTIMSAQKWEEVKSSGDAAIKKWIADQMAGKTALVVLVGAKTSERPWVKYEIEKAWNDKLPLVGIRIHGLKNKEGLTDYSGPNPFAKSSLTSGKKISDYVSLHDPAGSSSDKVYESISNNISDWVKGAYKPS